MEGVLEFALGSHSLCALGLSLCTCKPGVRPIATVPFDLARDPLEEPEDMG